VTKMSVPPWFVPGDLLHLGMAAGLVLVAPWVASRDLGRGLPPA